MDCELNTILVARYFISDSDEEIHESINPQSFDEICELLMKLRDDNPDVIYTLCAEIQA